MSRNTLENDQIKTLIEEKFKESVCISITSNMLKKHHIDSNRKIVKLLLQGGVIDFANIQNGGKEVKKVNIVTKIETSESLGSFYRSSNRGSHKGDPRFWITQLKKDLREGNSFHLFACDKELYILYQNDWNDESDLAARLAEIESCSFLKVLGRLKEKFEKIRGNPIESISPFFKSDRDGGATLERELSINANSSKLADFESKIEVKSKSSKTTSKDSNWSQVPDWSISPIASTNKLILKYGKQDSKLFKYPNFLSLWDEVGVNDFSPSGFKLSVNLEEERLEMFHKDDGLLCCWKFKEIENRLKTKHPATVWTTYSSELKEDRIHFVYESAELTQGADFVKFIQSIERGDIKFCWRARVRKDGTGYDDHGNGFRSSRRARNFIFGDSQVL
jgi:hypothetical protein